MRVVASTRPYRVALYARVATSDVIGPRSIAGQFEACRIVLEGQVTSHTSDPSKQCKF